MPNLTSDITVPDDSVRLSFVHSRGPGGQNVNKVATAVELRFSIARSGLNARVKSRLRELAGQRLTREDEVILFAQESRSQLRNRIAALERLADLIRTASIRPKRRIPTRPSRSAKAARTDTKKRRGSTKRNRSKPNLDH